MRGPPYTHTLCSQAEEAKRDQGSTTPAAPSQETTPTGFLRPGPCKIETPRLVLLPLTAERGKSIYVTAFKDTAHLSCIASVTEAIKTAARRDSYVRQQLEQWKDQTRYQYIAYEKATQEEVGMMCIFHPGHAPEASEIGYGQSAHMNRTTTHHASESHSASLLCLPFFLHVIN